MEAAYYEQYLHRPLVAVAIIIFANEEVRGISKKVAGGWLA